MSDTVVVHIRNKQIVQKISGPAYEVSNRGGITVAVRKVDDNKYLLAEAFCHESDNFNKKIGRDKALGRLKGQGAIEIHFENNPDPATFEGRSDIIKTIYEMYD